MLDDLTFDVVLTDRPDYNKSTRDELIKQAGELAVVFPDEYQVFLDLDQAQDQYVMEALLPLFKERGFPLKVEKVTRSKNGGKHVYLRATQPLGPERRLLIQAILGSDRKREALGFLRLVNNEEYTSCFFEVPGAPTET